MLNIAIISQHSPMLQKVISAYLLKWDIEFTFCTRQYMLDSLIEKDFFDIIFFDTKFLKESFHSSDVIVFTNTIYFIEALSILEDPKSAEQIEAQLISALKKLKIEKKPGYLYFHENKTSIYLNPKNIIYFEYVERKVRVITISKAYFIHCSLRELKIALEVYGFASPHKAFLVNLYEIKEISFDGILLTNGDAVPIAKRNVAKFKILHENFRENFMEKVNK